MIQTTLYISISSLAKKTGGKHHQAIYFLLLHLYSFAVLSLINIPAIPITDLLL